MCRHLLLRYGSWNEEPDDGAIGEGKYGGGPGSPDIRNIDNYGTGGGRGFYMQGAEEKGGMDDGLHVHGGMDEKMGLDNSYGDSEGMGSSSGGMDDYGRWQN